MRKLLFTLTLFGIIGGGAFAQITRANKLYDNYHYADAIPHYLRALKSKENAEVLTKLGDCYRLTRQYEEAETFYARAISYPDANHNAHIHYGEVLKNNNKVDAAKEVFVVYAREVNPADDLRGEKFAFSCDKIRAWENSPDKFIVKRRNKRKDTK